MAFFRKLFRIVDYVNDYMAFAGGAVLVGLMLLITGGVIFRYVLHRPFGWLVEIIEYSLVVITFLVIPWVLKQDGHVRMDLVLHALKPKHRYLVIAITSFVSSIVCLCLSVIGIRVTLELYSRDYFTPTILMVPKFIFIAFIAFGFLNMFVQFIQMGCNNYNDSKSSVEEEKQRVVTWSGI